MKPNEVTDEQLKDPGASEVTQSLVIYPGRFQPSHKGHKAVYDHLVEKYGRDSVYIATSDKVDPPRSPFNFQEKLKIMTAMGIPASRIKQVKNPYIATEITSKVDAATTAVLFAVSAKDMATDPRFTFKPKKNGSPSYFQKLPDNRNDLVGLEEHGYITTVPTFNFKVLNEPMKSATEIRAMFSGLEYKQQALLIRDLFGTYTEELHDLMANKITESVTEDQFTVNESEPTVLNRLQRVAGALREASPQLRSKVASVVSSLTARVREGQDTELEEAVARLETMAEEYTTFTAASTPSNLSENISNINNLIESISKMNSADVMKSEVTVRGAGTYSVEMLMSKIKRSLAELNDQAASDNPRNYRNIKSQLDSGMLKAMIDALVEAFNDIAKQRTKGGRNSRNIEQGKY